MTMWTKKSDFDVDRVNGVMMLSDNPPRPIPDDFADRMVKSLRDGTGVEIVVMHNGRHPWGYDK